MGSPMINPNVGPPDAGARFIGVQKEVRVTQPAAGTDWRYVVEGGTWQRVACAFARLQTSAVVASRQPLLQLMNADGDLVFANILNTNHTAGQLWRYSFIPGNQAAPYSGAGTNLIGFPSFWLPAGWQFGVSTSNIDAGDQWSGIRLVVEELDRGPLGEQVGTDVSSSF